MRWKRLELNVPAPEECRLDEHRNRIEWSSPEVRSNGRSRTEMEQLGGTEQGTGTVWNGLEWRSYRAEKQRQGGARRRNAVKGHCIDMTSEGIAVLGKDKQRRSQERKSNDMAVCRNGEIILDREESALFIKNMIHPDLDAIKRRDEFLDGITIDIQGDCIIAKCDIELPKDG